MSKTFNHQDKSKIGSCNAYPNEYDNRRDDTGEVFRIIGEGLGNSIDIRVYGGRWEEYKADLIPGKAGDICRESRREPVAKVVACRRQ